MVKALIFFLLFINNAFSVDGMVTVLEAPVFSKPDDKTHVIQYIRKGEIIYLHPEESHQDLYSEQNYTKSPEDFELKDDDLFLNEKTIYKKVEGNKFLKTITKSGLPGYILKEHVLLLFKDKREFNSRVSSFDNTDYRLEEPLDPDYPFILDGKYRAHATLSLGQPNFRHYPFRQNIKDTSYDFSKELTLSYTKYTDEQLFSRRLFFGLSVSLYSSSHKYILQDQEATQENFYIKLGPSITYDMFRTENFTLNSFLNLNFVVYDSMEITIKDEDDADTRLYRNSFNVQPTIGSHLKFHNLMKKTEVTLGFNLNARLPQDYQAVDAGGNDRFWQSQSNADSFEQPLQAELSYSIGLQSLY